MGNYLTILPLSKNIITSYAVDIWIHNFSMTKAMEFSFCSFCEIGNKSVQYWVQHLTQSHPLSGHWMSDEAAQLVGKEAQSPYTTIIKSKKRRRYASVPRPLNSFMIFSRHIRHCILSVLPEISNSEISKEIGICWNSTLPGNIKRQYEQEAKRLIDIHKQEFPSYKFNPRKNKKARSFSDKKRDNDSLSSTDDESTTINKKKESSTTSLDRIIDDCVKVFNVPTNTQNNSKALIGDRFKLTNNTPIITDSSKVIAPETNNVTCASSLSVPTPICPPQTPVVNVFMLTNPDDIKNLLIQYLMMNAQANISNQHLCSNSHSQINNVASLFLPQENSSMSTGTHNIVVNAEEQQTGSLKSFDHYAHTPIIMRSSSPSVEISQKKSVMVDEVECDTSIEDILNLSMQ